MIHVTNGPLWARGLGAHMAGAGSYRPRPARKPRSGFWSVIFALGIGAVAMFVVASVAQYAAWWRALGHAYGWWP